jgi:hypothetical protein
MNDSTKAGMHGSGQRTARAGSIRSGQGARRANGVGTGYNQQSASRPAMRPAPPVLSDAAHTSRDAQKIVRRPAMPFADPQGSLNTPAPTSNYVNTRKSKDNVYYDGGSPVNPLQKAGGYSVKEVGCGNTSLSKEEMAAIGYGAKDTTSSDPIISGHPTRNAQRQSGTPGTRSKNASRREQAAVRQSPIKLY